MFKHVLPLVVLAGLAACSTDARLGGVPGNAATGSAAGSSTTDASGQLEHCSASLGTLGIEEDQGAYWYTYLSQYQLPSTVPVLRTIVQQSNCFVIVERGHTMNSLMQERALGASGELRQHSNMGRGQMAAADYTMSPSINFSQHGTSGLGGVAGLVPIFGGALAAVGGATKSNDASTTLLLIDNRSSVQIAAAQGNARNWDIAGLGGLFGYGGGGALGAYSSTPEGKIIAASFMDSYNQMVRSLRNYQAQTVSGGLGTGGLLGVQGGSTPASRGIR